MIETVLLKVASRCNIDCSYCYVYHMGDHGWLRQPKMMSPQTCMAVGSALNELAFGYGHQFAVVLHGGEPLLLGKDALGFVLNHSTQFSSENLCNRYPNQWDSDNY